jgi:membrane-bound lytic murein transglycosylase A
MHLILITAFILFSLDAGATQAMTQVPAPEIPAEIIDDADQGVFEAGSRAQLKLAITRQLERCIAQPQNEKWKFGKQKITRAHWCVKTLGWFLEKLDRVSGIAELYTLARQELDWYQAKGATPEGDAHFTGYFYPRMRVKLKPDSVYRFPIYEKPADLVQVSVGGKLVWRRKVGSRYIPHFTRAEIRAGALNGQGLEIAYANNPIDPYLLEVQGSGELILMNDVGEEEGKILANYSAQNGRDYQSLGKAMRAAGVPDEYISMQGIRKYFTEVRPDLWDSMSALNESQVFFAPAKQGPFGAANVILTPKHSIAVDKTIYPFGAMTLVRSVRPSKIVGEYAAEWKSFAQFMITQDTGGAIRGTGRVDLYYGSGAYAEVAAGQTDSPGEVYFVITRDESTVQSWWRTISDFSLPW